MSNLNEDIKSTDRSSVILPGGMDEIDDSELENTARYLKSAFDSMGRRQNNTMPEGSFIQYIFSLLSLVKNYLIVHTTNQTNRMLPALLLQNILRLPVHLIMK